MFPNSHDSGPQCWLPESKIRSFAGKILPAVLILVAPVFQASVGLSQTARRAAPQARAASPAVPAEFEKVAQQAGEAREANRLPEALALYQKAVKLNPKWDEGWWYLGTLYYDGNQYAECTDAFKSLVEVSPKYGPGWALLGLCEFELKDYENAFIHLQRGRAYGVGENRELINSARYHQALIEILHSNFDNAKFLLSSLITQNVLTNNVKQAMGLALLHVPLLPGQTDPSKDALIDAAGHIGELEALNDMDEANRAFQALVRDFPDAPFVHYAYGSLLTELSKYKDAEAQLLEELKINPGSSMPAMQLAYVYIRQNRFEDAMPLAKKATELAPQSFAAHYLLGRCYLGTDHVIQAVNELKIAKRLGPFSPEVRYNLARALARAKRPQEAAQEVAEFKRLNSLAQKAHQNSQPLSYRNSGERGETVPTSHDGEPVETGPPQN